MSSTEIRNRNEYQTIPLAELQDSATNPRTRIDQNALNELAENIKQKGILQPLLVRPLEDKRFEVVFGRRRFLAAQLAEQKAAPCRIRPMSDTEAMEAQLIENRQRQDVHPLEESRAFKALLDLPEAKHTPATLAAKVSKTEAYVVNRVRLTELIETVAQAFLADEIAIGHALLIAKLPAAQQQEAFNAAFRQTWTSDGNQRVLIPVRELAAWIHTNILLELAAASFSKSDEKLLPEAGSCANCPKRTGFNALLFADVRKDSCTDPQCFQAKINAHVTQTIVRKPELVQISSAHGTRADAPLGRNRYVELQIKATGKNGKASPSSPAEKPCRSMTEAIVMDGGRRGQIVEVCADSKCRIHNADHQRPTSEDVEKQRAAERKRIETQKIEITIRHHVLAAILGKVQSPLAKPELEIVATRLIDKLEYQRKVLLAKRHKLLSGRNSDADFALIEKELTKFVKHADEKILSRLLLECLLLETAYVAPASGNDLLLTTAKRHRIDVEKLSRQVREDFAAKAKKTAVKPEKNAKAKVAKAVA